MHMARQKGKEESVSGNGIVLLCCPTPAGKESMESVLLVCRKQQYRVSLDSWYCRWLAMARWMRSRRPNKPSGLSAD